MPQRRAHCSPWQRRTTPSTRSRPGRHSRRALPQRPRRRARAVDAPGGARPRLAISANRKRKRRRRRARTSSWKRRGGGCARRPRRSDGADDAAPLVQTPSLAKDQGWWPLKTGRRQGRGAPTSSPAVDADRGKGRAARRGGRAAPQEAAVTTGVCEHVFCRGCLEDHCAQASKPSECVCPLCRKPLVNDESGRVEASAAALVRANMKKLRGECHCGARMPLSRLRDHLRACGPNAHLYPPRRKFGHEFRQPSFVGGGASAPSVDLAAEEEAALQAAILASLEG